MIAAAGAERELEAELMSRVARGDLRAFEALYDRLSDLAFGFALRLLNDRGTAADVTQEAFLQLWRHRESYQTARGTPSSWLLAMVRNRAIDAHRHGESRGGPPREQPNHTERSAPDNTEALTITRERAGIVRAALERLPQEQRAVIHLTYFGGLTQAEAADQLKVPLGTVKGRTRLAMNRLSRSLVQLASSG
jgi:RNA polymerase sigma-70 factor (ECF subfamily)